MNFKILKTFCFVTLTLLWATSALAYVPSTQFIFSRVATNHGKGDFNVEDDVAIHDGSENYTVHENWVVAENGDMRVSAQSDAFHVFKVLKRGRGYWFEDGGGEKSAELDADSYMKLLFLKNATELKRIFVNWNILPTEVLKEKKLPKEAKDLQYKPESFVRLSRTAGTVTLAYGKPAPTDGALPAGVWIEQDAFNIRKIRTPEQDEIQLNDYGTFSRGLIFPRTQIVTWGTKTANIRVTKVNGISLSGDLKKQLDPTWFRGHPDSFTRWPKNASSTLVEDFYKHFR